MRNHLLISIVFLLVASTGVAQVKFKRKIDYLDQNFYEAKKSDHYYAVRTDQLGVSYYFVGDELRIMTMIAPDIQLVLIPKTNQFVISEGINGHHSAETVFDQEGYLREHRYFLNRPTIDLDNTFSVKKVAFKNHGLEEKLTEKFSDFSIDETLNIENYAPTKVFAVHFEGVSEILYEGEVENKWLTALIPDFSFLMEEVLSDTILSDEVYIVSYIFSIDKGKVVVKREDDDAAYEDLCDCIEDFRNHMYQSALELLYNN